MNSRISYFLSTLCCLFVLGCGADYLDVNDDPNSAIRPPLDGLLASAAYNTALNHQSVSNGYSSYFVQYLASPNASNNTDIYLDVSGDGAWNSIYDTMTDLYDLIRFAEEDGLLRHAAIGRVLMVMNLGLIVDSWGDAPYSDAFTGETLTPAYDDAETLYTTIDGLLASAITSLEGAGADAPAVKSGSDFVYDGDATNWLRAAYSLRARYLNHLSETGQYDPAAVLAAVSNGFMSNVDNAAVSTFNPRNPWAQVAENNSNLVLGGWLSEQFIDATNGETFGTPDPRLPLLTNLNADGEYVGTPNGVGRRGDGTEIEESYLVTDGALSMEDSPLYMITFAEVKLIEAEAALASGDDARARSAFREGVVADMEAIGVDSAAAVAYLNVEYGDPLTREDIFREKYIALFLNPETWVDARRYDYAYTDFELAANAALSTFPLRLLYPATETDRNRANVPEVTMTEPLFWDQ
jgi:hypothetical protein